VSDASELPDGWKVVALGEVAKVVGGGTPKTSVTGNFTESGGHPWITPADLTGYTKKYIARGRRNLTDQGLATSSATYMPAGTVLFSTRAPIGYVAIAENPVTTNQGFRSFVPSPEVDSEFLYYALKLARYEAEHLASGTTFAELSGTNAKKLQLALAPLEDQRRLVSLLDRTTDRFASAEDHLALARKALERLRKAVLVAACTGQLSADWRHANPDAESVESALALRSVPRGRRTREDPVELDLPELPNSYLVASVGEVADLIEYGTSKKCDAGPGVPVLRMGNIQNGTLDLTDLRYCREDAETARLMLQEGDLLFNRTNSPELVGKSAVFHGGFPMSFASYLIRVRFDSAVILPDFANYWLNSAWGRAWAQLAKTDGVSQSNINGSKLALLPLPLPPLGEQEVIVERASRMLGVADSLLVRADGIEATLHRGSLSVLAKAFRGELTGAAKA
jgi:type I restriction enzyme S subunit